ncbi:MAG: hypothetical protein HUJ51_01130 [Eggerthellaceae bacterium]|nr:hypothetical protein [Eggerthellaceae bacterium]
MIKVFDASWIREGIANEFQISRVVHRLGITSVNSFKFTMAGELTGIDSEYVFSGMLNELMYLNYYEFWEVY